ncbi:hypothetical protein NLI96_g7144 [Meripilus lineatus]|uniref:PAN2-PAN3 deadenylation complex subunit PAN3 n=1 Tax=Meripilus lineatus TaxID=2056292 RepID=A0AAD5YD82_9APHY|nr:hypothetical protein NLI96_g7144 [Physisporinus lineatus]
MGSTDHVNIRIKAVSTTTLRPPDSPVPAPALPAQSVNAPVFVPKIPIPTSSPPPVSAPNAIQYLHSQSSSSSSGTGDLQEDLTAYDEYGYPLVNGEPHIDTLVGQMQAVEVNPYDSPQLMGYDGPDTLDVFYTPQAPFVRQPLQYHLYTQPRPDTLQRRFFISDSIRDDLQKRSETIQTAPAPGLGLPEEIQGYHSLIPIEPVVSDKRKMGTFSTVTYRAINSKDGLPYVLRRVEMDSDDSDFRLGQQAAFSAIEAWAKIRHSNIVPVREAFTTRAFGDSSLVVVYDYFPNSQTLYEAHLKPKAPQFQNGRLQSQNVRLIERTLWSYIIQLAGAIKAVHDAGLAVRVVDVTKILVTSKNRIRINCCGLYDVLMFEARQDVAMLQHEDLQMLGKVVFSLGCYNVSPLNNIPRSLETITRQYSQDVRNVAVYLINKPDRHKTINHLIEIISPRVMKELEENEAELMSELENGRLVRLLCKFGFINERPEFARDARWSETGDRYMVKLFRDYVFHQVDEHGRPVVNLSHVLTCLNKLDAGSEEKIMLVSRDEQSCLVVSFKDVKTNMESAFNDLSSGYAG